MSARLKTSDGRAMKRTFEVAVLAAVFAGGSLAAQAPPAPPRDSATGGIIVPQSQMSHPRSTTSATVRARLLSNDGRVLVTRGGSGPAMAWLVDTTAAADDSSVFTVTLSPSGNASITIADWQGRCLSLTGRESSIPLYFDACREPLAIHPAPDSSIAAGRAGFWLLSKVGIIGPTSVSPILIPQSRLKIWFRLQPVR